MVQTKLEREAERQARRNGLVELQMKEIAQHERRLARWRRLAKESETVVGNLSARAREDQVIRELAKRGAGPARIQEEILARLGWSITREAVTQRLKRMKKNRDL